MRLESTPMLSVIIPKSQEGELTYEWAKRELAGINHEILVPRRWEMGLTRASGDFVCFLEKDCVLGSNYFGPLMAQFLDKPSFRKLAMVSPTLGVNSYDNRVYGYRVAFRDIYPAFIPSSSAPYHIQIGYAPGSIIRRSALGDVSPQDGATLLDSVSLSLHLWSSGQRVILVPDSLYVSTQEDLDKPFWYQRQDDSLGVTKLFKREAIG